LDYLDGELPLSTSEEPRTLPTHLTYQILLALADDDRHGYGIIKEIELRGGPGSAPSTGALYLALQRMGGDGLIEDAPPPSSGSGDSRRRYYRLTAKGKKAAEEETARLAALVAVARTKKLLAEGA
jgi:DNA-binding PadR family transcriptional regulator